MERQIGSLRALAVLGVTLLLAAGCSVANPFASSNASAQQRAEELALKWAQCMRQHGVNVPDPDSNGRVRIEVTPGSSAGSGGAGSGSAAGAGGDGARSGGPDGTGGGPPPEVQAAMDACKQYQPKGGQASRQPNQQELDAMTKFAQCMRNHGIPMQDPKVSGGGVQIVGSPGAFEPDSDQFKQAQQACDHYLPNGGQGRTRTSNG